MHIDLRRWVRVMGGRSLRFSSGDPNQQVAHNSVFVEQVCLVLVIQFALDGYLLDSGDHNL